MKVLWRILVWFVLIVLYFVGIIWLIVFIPIYSYSGAWWVRLVIGMGWAGFILLLAALIGACADLAALSPCQPDWYRMIDQHDLFRADIVFVNCHWRLK